MLAKYLADLKSAIYYTAGPPAMVGAMVQILGKAGISMKQIRPEEFSGY